MLKRIFDTLLAIVLAVILAFPMILLSLFIKLSSPGPVFHWSERIGQNNVLFRMPKFRTMKRETPAVATHLLASPGQYLTRVGKVLRKYSLDELPQIFSVIVGKMSFVGPRPALFNQNDLVELRTRKGIHILIPGITGWAQINGRDELSIPRKVAFDEYYLNHRSFVFDLKILSMTLLNVIDSKGVTH